MSPNRWKVLACAILLAAFCATDTANPPNVIVGANPRIVIAMAAAQPAPPVARMVSAPIIAAPNPPVIANTITADLKTAITDMAKPSAVATNPPVVTPVSRAAKVAPVGTPRIAAADPPDAGAPAAIETKTPAAADTPHLTFDRRILLAHNREREDLGLGPLSWNPALAQAAQRWAEHLAETGRFEHAPENHVAPEGENLWAGTKGYYTPEAMVAAWIREKRYFRTGVFPDNSTTGNVEDIGHYTQVVWRATHEVGCAEAASASEDILVCRYAEAGNYRGERPF